MRSTEKVANKLTQRFNTFVKFPSTSEEIVKAKEEFYSIAQFPGVVAAIDCTRIRIRRPYTANAETYRNRKGYFSSFEINWTNIRNSDSGMVE